MTTTAYQYDAATHQYTGAVSCADGTCPPDATLTPLPDAAQPGDVWIWHGQWIQKADGVSVIAGFPSSLYVPMTEFAFLGRFLATERAAILTLAQTDMTATDFMNMLNKAPSILLNDARVVAGVNYCASKIPAMTVARVAAILNPSL
jgi:hypothetical protein